MNPDFTPKTVETIAKRSAYKCSNPDCRASTIGPNSDETKTTLIGEAAHIFGAREGSKRFDPEMSNKARSDLTNAIWLCRNCHKKIDTDEAMYSSNILFAWRQKHEEYILSELGTQTDKIFLEEQNSQLVQFREFPPLIKRIVIDKPDGWEWRLAAELLNHLNKDVLRQFRDLHEGLYIKDPIYLQDLEIFDWARQQLRELTRLLPPLEKLFSKLTESFGAPGEPGDQNEILHIAKLINQYLTEVLKVEERIHFTEVSDEFQEIPRLFKNIFGSQLQKLSEVPKHLNKVVSLIGTDHGGTEENPTIVHATIDFDLPEDWSEKINEEMRKLARFMQRNQ